jgi:phosphate transport system substrate-binding protein
MSRQTSSLAIYAIVALIIGIIVGYGLAGPLTYNAQINTLNTIIDDYETKGYSEQLSGTLTVGGSTTIEPIASECARLFQILHPDVEITVSGTGSGSGIRSAGVGDIDIGMSSRNIASNEWLLYPDLVSFAIGKDSVAIVVNPNNPLADTLDLTSAQIAQIFSGEINNWNQLGGDDRTIDVYTREEGSGTRDVFLTYVMTPNGKTIVGSATVKPSNGEMRAAVAGDRYGIAYISLGYVDSTVKASKLSGVEATVANVLSGSYPITRILWVFTKGFPNNLERAFIAYMQSEAGQNVLEEEGYIRLY